MKGIYASDRSEGGIRPMITLKDTVSKMLSSNWEDHLVSEIEQCDIRLYNLERHMDKIGKDSPEYSLLEAQRDAMGEYLKTITARATSFGIEYRLPSLEKRFKEWNKNIDTPSNQNDTMFYAFILLWLMMTGGESK